MCNAWSENFDFDVIIMQWIYSYIFMLVLFVCVPDNYCVILFLLLVPGFNNLRIVSLLCVFLFFGFKLRMFADVGFVYPSGDM